VRFFSNVYCCVVSFFPLLTWCNVPHSLT
jgi:hypothetical protein